MLTAVRCCAILPEPDRIEACIMRTLSFSPDPLMAAEDFAPCRIDPVNPVATEIDRARVDLQDHERDCGA